MNRTSQQGYTCTTQGLSRVVPGAATRPKSACRLAEKS